MSVLPRPFSSETGLRGSPIPLRQEILKSSAVRSTLMLTPNSQLVLVANSFGQGKFLWQLPTSRLVGLCPTTELD